MKGELNLSEFTKAFPNEASCIEFLEQARWSEGEPKSPFGGGVAYRIATRPGIYKCKATGQNFSVRQGTIFEDSRLPLKKWFFGIFVVHSLKESISSVQLAKFLGVTQKTAWFMLRRLRYAVEHQVFTKPLSETIATSSDSNGHRKTGTRGVQGAKAVPGRVGIGS